MDWNCHRVHPSLWNQLSELLHLKSRERISNPVENTWYMLSCESEAETCCRRRQLTQKIHDTRNLRVPRRKDVDHGFIIGAKQNMPTKPLRAPDVRCYDYRKQLLISNGLLRLTRRPSSSKQLSLEVSTETQGAGSVGSDLQVSNH